IEQGVIRERLAHNDAGRRRMNLPRKGVKRLSGSGRSLVENRREQRIPVPEALQAGRRRALVRREGDLREGSRLNEGEPYAIRVIQKSRGEERESGRRIVDERERTEAAGHAALGGENGVREIGNQASAAIEYSHQAAALQRRRALHRELIVL